MSRGDLENEGAVCLLSAIDGFDEDRGVKFKTYAYSVISRGLARYVTQNLTPISHPIVTQITRVGSNTLKAKLKTALACQSFTDFSHYLESKGDFNNRRPPAEFSDMILNLSTTSGQNHYDPPSEMEEKEHATACLKKLQDGLTEQQYDLLVMYYGGESTNNIAHELKTTPGAVRNAVSRILAKCRIILKEEIERD